MPLGAGFFQGRIIQRFARRGDTGNCVTLKKDFPIRDSGFPEESFGGFSDTLKKNEGGWQHRQL
jgi:hypothetical protein